MHILPVIHYLISVQEKEWFSYLGCHLPHLAVASALPGLCESLFEYPMDWLCVAQYHYIGPLGNGLVVSFFESLLSRPWDCFKGLRAEAEAGALAAAQHSTAQLRLGGGWLTLRKCSVLQLSSPLSFWSCAANTLGFDQASPLEQPPDSYTESLLLGGEKRASLT